MLLARVSIRKNYVKMKVRQAKLQEKVTHRMIISFGEYLAPIDQYVASACFCSAQLNPQP